MYSLHNDYILQYVFHYDISLHTMVINYDFLPIIYYCLLI